MSSHGTNHPGEAHPDASCQETCEPNPEASVKQTFDKGCSIESLVQLGLDTTVAQALRKMKVTKLTAAQNAVVTSYLSTVKDSNGSSVIPSYQISSGPATGKTLAHAIVVVDYLVKYRAWMADRSNSMNSAEKDSNADIALNSAFSTGTSHAIVVCPSHSHASHTYEIYKKMCDEVSIAVCHVGAHDGLSRLRVDRDDIKQIEKSQAIIAIGTLGQLLCVANTESHKQTTLILTGAHEGKGTTLDARFNATDATSATASRLFNTTKVVVIDHSFVYPRRKWEEDFAQLRRTVLPFVDARCAFIVVPQQSVVDFVSFLDLRYSVDSSSTSCYLVKYVEETTRNNTVPWRVVPYGAIPEFDKHDYMSSLPVLSLKVMEKLQLRKRTSSKFTTILVAANSSMVESLYNMQMRFDKEFEHDAAYIHRLMDPDVIGRILREFEAGKKTILFITADLVANIDLRVDQVIAHLRSGAENSDIDNVIGNVTSARRLGRNGPTHIFFRYDISDRMAFESVYTKLQEIDPASIDQPSFEHALKRLRDAAEDAEQVMYAIEYAKEDLDIHEKGIKIGDSYYSLLSIEQSEIPELDENDKTDFESSATLEPRVEKSSPPMGNPVSIDRPEDF